ncbi:LysR family transcriptional regulator [Paenibacillus profundus]|uniref:LysR family transcriptional regulator n=1 Tax=Paenibacillus profundus TaxID=1173085 RepID=A0ABS8Y9B0_9BACL|nr:MULTISPECIES: LysR family transcriptional regulator [Paenibacillus]MCE5168433.1 LysR family transcriptional regulator [Paenibacillus profundus]MCM3339274.1 LysR family transcriptional regulator [Paenibacillus sp. MER TA 81-3]
MDLKWIHTFVHAAAHENFRRTAEDLYISQPTVTIQMKQLEQYLGCQLFTRVGRRVQLTEAGRRFLPHAKHLLDVHKEGLQDLLRFKQGFSRSLNLAVSPLVAAYLIPHVLSQYVDTNPDVEIQVQVLESKHIADAVLQNQVDLGLSRMWANDDSLSCEVLGEDRVILVAPHDGYDNEVAAPLDLEELLARHMLLTYNHPEYWEPIMQELQMRYPYLRTMLVTQVHVTKRFIEEGLGISFLPEITVRRERMEGRLLQVDCPELKLPTARTYAIMKRDVTEGRRFLDFFRSFM